MTGKTEPISCRYGELLVAAGAATRVGGRAVNADAVNVQANPLGAGAAVVDGIGGSPTVVAAARVAADTAAVVASHRGAQAGILAAADTMPDYPDAPNGVAAVASIDRFGRIEIAHVGDAAAWTWSAAAGLRRQTADETVGQHIAYMLSNPTIAGSDRDVLEAHAGRVVSALDDYVLGTLVRASVATVSWTPLRGDAAAVDVIVLTSDGVHKVLPVDRMAALVEEHAGDAQGLADALVDSAVSAASSRQDEVADNATAAVFAIPSRIGTAARPLPVIRPCCARSWRPRHIREGLAFCVSGVSH